MQPGILLKHHPGVAAGAPIANKVSSPQGQREKLENVTPWGI